MDELVINTEIEDFATVEGHRGRVIGWTLRATKRQGKEMYPLALRVLGLLVFR